MKLRRSLLIGAAIGALCFVKADAAIPVIDNAALVQWVHQLEAEVKAYALQIEQYTVQAKQWATQNLQWAAQLKQYAMQGQQYLQEIELYNNFFHNPTLIGAMGLINQAGLGNGLPLNGYAAISLINGFTSLKNGHGGMFALAGVLNNLNALSSGIWATNHIYTPTDGSWEAQQSIARADSIAAMQGISNQTYDDARAHAAVLGGLQQDLARASDTKTVLDATAQVNQQIAWNVNTLVQNQAAFDAYQAQQANLVQRENEKMSKDIHEALANSPARDIVPVNLGANP